MDLNHIRFLESAENVKALVRQHRNRDISTELAREITACIQQGRQFYELATTSPLEIRPLVQFYGMVGFAKAIVLNQRLCRLSTLPASHGIRDISPQGARMLELSARIDRRGTFVDFNTEVSQLNRVCYLGPVGEPLSAAAPCAASEHLADRNFSLKDVLSRSPDSKLYQYTLGERPNAQSLGYLSFDERDNYFSVQLAEDRPIRDRAHLSEMVAKWRTSYPYLARWRVIEAMNSWGTSAVTFANLSTPRVDDTAEDLLQQVDPNIFRAQNLFPDGLNVERLPIDGSLLGVAGGFSNSLCHAIAPIEQLYVSEFSLSYIGLFLLSSLVRYRPDSWSHAVSRTLLADRPSDDRALALIQEFLEANARDVPSLAIKVINPNEDKYG